MCQFLLKNRSSIVNQLQTDGRHSWLHQIKHLLLICSRYVAFLPLSPCDNKMSEMWHAVFSWPWLRGGEIISHFNFNFSIRGGRRQEKNLTFCLVCFWRYLSVTAPYPSHYSKHPRIRTENFWVQAEWVLIFWGSFSELRLIRFLVGSYL